jgi:hypothetical protein
MAGFADVLLRGLLLALTSLALGGVVWTLVVLRAGPGVKADALTARAQDAARPHHTAGREAGERQQQSPQQDVGEPRHLRRWGAMSGPPIF